MIVKGVYDFDFFIETVKVDHFWMYYSFHKITGVNLPMLYSEYEIQGTLVYIACNTEDHICFKLILLT